MKPAMQSRLTFSRLSARLVLGAVLLVACFYNLNNYPTIWWDEAIFSETAANLSQSGRYALTVQSPDQFSDLDFRISAGPMVILPVALAYRVLGVGLLPGRLVAAVYLLLTFLALFLATRRLWGSSTGVLAVFLALLGTDVLYWGRSVMGDVPALGLFLMSLWFLLRGFDSGEDRWLFLGGLCLGLAFAAKEFYGAAFLPPLFVLARREWTNPGRLFRQGALLCLGIFLPLAAYLLLKVAILGSLTAAVSHFLDQKALLRYEFFTPVTLGRIYPESFAYLLGHPLFWLGILGSCWCWRQEGLTPGLTLWFTNLLLWSLIYLTAVYWHRFALPALFLACAPGAHLLGCLYRRLAVLFTHRRTQGLAALTLGSFLFLCYPFAGLDILDTVLTCKTSPCEKIKAYLKANIPMHCLIETPEYELAFLDDQHRFHLMPAFYFMESDENRTVLLNPRPHKYNFNRISADFLVLGSFGKSVFREIYPPGEVAKNWRKLAQVDFYDVYVRKSRENDAPLKNASPPKLSFKAKRTKADNSYGKQFSHHSVHH